MQPRPLWPRILTAMLVLLVAFVGWLFAAGSAIDRLRPKGQTLAEHFVTMPEPEAFWEKRTPTGTYLFVQGESRPLYTLPSGSPVYVFDSAGRLVDTTIDDGDDEAFNTRWSGVRGRTLTRAEAEQWPTKVPRNGP